ncbi:MAG: FtsQ-type POTRA domain-containing protein [Bacillota bacterium]|nr:FtsQ-type POTRA domain-containing protein [Bacillota bacterium]
MMKENRTVKNVRKKKRRKKRYALKFCLLVLICAGIYFALHIDYFDVDGIAVVGNKEISDGEILKLSELKEGDNLFDVHPFLVQRKIKKNLYIEDVNVNRKLPCKVEIIVSERSGKAQLTFGKKYVVTDNEGMVLEISGEEKKATLIEGVEVTEAELKKTVKVKDTDTWSKAMELIRITEENDLYFKKVKIEGDNVSAYVFDKLVCKGKYDDVVDNIQNDALKAVVFDLYQKGTEAGVINIGSNNYCSFTP